MGGLSYKSETRIILGLGIFLHFFVAIFMTDCGTYWQNTLEYLVCILSSAIQGILVCALLIPIFYYCKPKTKRENFGPRAFAWAVLVGVIFRMFF